MRRSFLIFLVLLQVFSVSSALAAVKVVNPDSSRTPGELCTEDNEYFDDYYYPSHVPRCKRHVTHEDKLKIAKPYGVPESEWRNYEFDHLIPLCAGGTNSIKNLWPQPLDEAHDKDIVEDDVCRKMRAGEMTQEEAIQKINEWFDDRRTFLVH